jgi:hypothetical protein
VTVDQPVISFAGLTRTSGAPLIKTGSDQIAKGAVRLALFATRRSTAFE